MNLLRLGRNVFCAPTGSTEGVTILGPLIRGESIRDEDGSAVPVECDLDTSESRGGEYDSSIDLPGEHSFNSRGRSLTIILGVCSGVLTMARERRLEGVAAAMTFAMICLAPRMLCLLGLL